MLSYYWYAPTLNCREIHIENEKLHLCDEHSAEENRQWKQKRDIKKGRYRICIIRVFPHLQSNLYCMQWHEKYYFLKNDLQLFFF